MAANETLRFDILAVDKASSGFSAAGRSASEAAGNVDKLTRRLDEVSKKSATARVGLAGDKEAQAALDRLDAKLLGLDRRVASPHLKVEGAARAIADISAVGLELDKLDSKTRKATDDNNRFAASLQKIADGAKARGGPAWLGPALALAPAAGTLTGVAGGAAIGLGGAFVAGGAALAAFGSVATPVLAAALKAEQAVGTAQDAYTLSVQKTTAQYQVAMAAAKTQAQRNAAYAAEQKGFAADRLAETQAVSKAYIGLSPQQVALSKQLGDMASAWKAVKAAETPVVAGALQPWLKSVTDLTGKLSPIINAVAPVIGDLGTRIDGLVQSPEFAKFLNFVTGTGTAAVGAAGGTLIDFIDAFITLLPKFTPLINGAVNGIAGLGPAVLAWSNSKKASDDITKFMAWFSANGPVVAGLLKNIGGSLKALAPGLTAGGTAELKIVSDFFGWVAKLPPSVAKPLLEVTGALLTLNKLGVLSVGVKFTGKVASWLTGGVVSIGSGASAAAEMQAAMTAGGASAAAEIRAAMAAGGTAAGAEAAAGEAAGGVSAGGAVVAAERAAAPAIGTMIGLAVAAQIGGYLAEKQFSNLFNAGVAGASSAGGTGLRQAAALPAVLAGTGANASLSFKVDTRPLDNLLKELGFTQLAIGQINKLTAKPGANTGQVDALIYKLGGTQSDILAVNKLTAKPASDTVKIDALLAKINLTPGEIANVNKLIAKPGSNTAQIDALLRQIGLTPPQIAAANRLILKPHSDTSPVTSLQRSINALHGKTVAVDVTIGGEGAIVASAVGLPARIFKLSHMASGGRVPGYGGGDRFPALLEGGEVVVPKGMVAGGAVDHLKGKLPGFAAGGLVDAAPWSGGQGSGAAGGWAGSWVQGEVAAFFAAARAAAAAGTPVAYSKNAGVTQWEADVARVLGMLRLPQGDLPTVMSQMLTESGGNPNAINNWDSNAAAGTPSKGLMQVIAPTFAAYRSPALSSNIYDPMANIFAGVNYAIHRYGNPGWLSVLGHGHGYDNGGYLPPGLSLAYNGTGVPEPVIPARRLGGEVHHHYNVTVNVPPTVNPREAGREIAQLLLKHTGTGGKLYPPGTRPQ
jgi:hypothetical protein